jgi:hypothetical protein
VELAISLAIWSMCFLIVCWRWWKWIRDWRQMRRDFAEIVRQGWSIENIEMLAVPDLTVGDIWPEDD